MKEGRCVFLLLSAHPLAERVGARNVTCMRNFFLLNIADFYFHERTLVSMSRDLWFYLKKRPLYGLRVSFSMHVMKESSALLGRFSKNFSVFKNQQLKEKANRIYKILIWNFSNLIYIWYGLSQIYTVYQYTTSRLFLQLQMTNCQPFIQITKSNQVAPSGRSCQC